MYSDISCDMPDNIIYCQETYLRYPYYTWKGENGMHETYRRTHIP